MRIALCEDSIPELEELQRALEQYRQQRPSLQISFACFRSGEELLHCASQAPFHLYLLDIVMPGLTGLETARRLKQMGPAAPVIFLTSSADFALEAFQVRASNYLLKPVRASALFEALDELLTGQQLHMTELAAEGGGSVVLPVGRILYLECSNHRILYYLDDGSTVRGRTIRTPFLQAAAPLLHNGVFLQPHRSYLVNASHILRLTSRSVVLDNGTELAVSQMKLRSFRQQYMDYLSGGEL